MITRVVECTTEIPMPFLPVVKIQLSCYQLRTDAHQAYELTFCFSIPIHSRISS